MKKIIASAVGLMLAGGLSVTTAQAVENQFGGYWRTRAFVQDAFTPANESQTRIDTRTRLYYTAKMSDDLKLVTKFQYDAIYGDAVAGAVGLRGNLTVLEAFADFNLGNTNTVVGKQLFTLARGFLMDDRGAGVKVTGKFGNVNVTPLWVRVDAEDFVPTKTNTRDYYGVLAGIKVSDALMVTPYFIADMNSGSESWDNYYLGADVDMKMDAASVWGTFIYNTYEIDTLGDVGVDVDGDAFLVAAGVKAGMVRGQAFYASGDDAFVSPAGSAYYWAEIMGLGIFDNQRSGGSPGAAISNIVAFGGGVTVKPADKISLDFDVWYAFLDEENAVGDDELGLEFDAKLTWQMVDKLRAEFVAAYLVAGDATNGGEDAFEGGVRLSLSF